MYKLRLSKFIKTRCFLLFSFCFIYLIILFIWFDEKLFIRHNPSGRITIISVTYYNSSTLYKPNTIVLHFNADKWLSTDQIWICVTKNNKGEMLKSIIKPYAAFHTLPYCKYQTYASNCSSVPNPLYFAIATLPALKLSKNSGIQIPLRIAVPKKFNVVSCVSPIFFNEQWHINILSIETYAYFGVNKQIYYFMSAIKDNFKLLKEYEKFGLIILHPWIVPDVDGNNIRQELDFRNQAAALNDCYLHYRESAEFIIAHDPDDIFIPTKAKTIYENAIKSFAINPNAAWIPYMKYNAAVKFSKELLSFSLLDILNSIRISDQKQREKALHRTKLVGSAWTHYARTVKDGYDEYEITPEHGFFVHVRNITFTSEKVNGDEEIPEFAYNSLFKDLISMIGEKSINEMDQTFRKRRIQLLNYKILKNLTLTDYYSSMLDECYETMYYNSPLRGKHCPTHFKCKIPKIKGLQCIQAEQNFKKERIGDLFIHQGIDKPVLKLKKDGCSL